MLYRFLKYLLLDYLFIAIAGILMVVTAVLFLWLMAGGWEWLGHNWPLPQ